MLLYTTSESQQTLAPLSSWRSWVHGFERDAAFVGLGLLGMALGFIAEARGWPLLVVWAGWATAYGFGGWHGLVAGLRSLRDGAIDIDLLMILAALGALVIGAPFEGALLLFLFSLSEVLQAIALGRSRRAIEALMGLRPDSAEVRRGDALVTVPLDEVAVGDVYEVRPGDRLPLDGTIVEGRAALDQASLTGESVPVTKQEGDEVFGGTINTDGHLAVRVAKRESESALARMIALVEEAQGRKAETQRLLDRFESPYAITILVLTALAVAVPVFGWDAAFEPTFYRAMTLLVAASPCALVISTPAAVLSAIASGARRGVLFKGGVYVEELATVKAIAFDKTGTLTEGRTRLSDLVAFEETGRSADDLLRRAAAVQARSEHHLAHATVEAAREQNLDGADAADFQATVGQGVAATVEGVRLHIGNARYFADEDSRFDAARRQIKAFEADAQTGVIVAEEADGQRRPVGALAFADTMRDAAPGVVRALKEAGIVHVAMLTGDNAGVARHIADQVGGVDAVYADLLPERKVHLIREIQQQYGPTMMVGDGVNDAPALAAASVGVAMGAAGTDVALETADLVLMADDLDKLTYAVALSKAARRTLIVNLTFSVAVIVVMIGFILTIGLPLPLAVVGHEGSTVLVALNGLRLLSFDG